MNAKQELVEQPPAQRVEIIPDPPREPVSEATALIHLFERAAMNPQMDLDRLERIQQMHAQVQARQAEAAYNAAMSLAQAEMAPVSYDAENTHTKSRYTTYAALDRAIRPIYTKHGFSLSFYPGSGAPDGFVRVGCKIAHKDGHSERPEVDMPADGSGAKGGAVMTKTHATGSAFSYGQRYLLRLIFNLATGEADDDGNAASGREKSEVAQRATEEINAAQTPADLALWKKNKAGGVEGVVSASEWTEIVRLWNRRAAAMKPKGDDHGA